MFGTGRTNGLAQYVQLAGLTLGAQFTGNNDPQNASRSERRPEQHLEPERFFRGYALSANYDFNMGLSLGAAYKPGRQD